jgi:hypothetical protein
MALGANVFVNMTSMWPALVVKLADAESGPSLPLPDPVKPITVACAATLDASTAAPASIEIDFGLSIKGSPPTGTITLNTRG